MRTTGTHGCAQDNNTLANVGSSWVDVRDVGLAHTLALGKPDAGGERLIVSAGPFKWQDWRKCFPPFLFSLAPPHTPRLNSARSTD